MPCNNDDYRQLCVGKVQDSSVAAAWRDRRVEEDRELHRQGRSHLVAACNGCPWRSAQILKNTPGE